MSSGIDDLWWFPHHALYQDVTSANAATVKQLGEELQKRKPWLLAGLANFKSPSDASAKLVNDSKALNFAAGKAAVEPRLVPATHDVSRLLQLDQVQAHILLKRCFREALQADTSRTPLQLTAADLQSVATAYFSERLFLLKALHMLLLDSTAGGQQEGEEEEEEEEEDGSQALPALTRALLQAGLQAEVVKQLQAALAPPVAPATSTARAPFHSAAAAQPELQAALAALRGEQRLQEACELLALLVLMYGQLGEACSGEVFLQLSRDLGAGLYGSAGGGGGAGAGASPALVLAQHLGCLCLLAGMRLQAVVTAVAQGGALSGTTAHLAGRAREVDQVLRSWAVVPANTLLLLTWAGYAKLLQRYMERPPQLATEEVQDAAMAAGGFGAAASVLAHEGISGSGRALEGYKGLLLKALAAVCTAFDLDPHAVDHSVFSGLVDLVAGVMAGGWCGGGGA
jgi:hypothetical protein